jgi:hypothetical protein
VRAANDRLDHGPVRLDPEIGVGKLHRLFQVFSTNRATPGAAPDIDPVIRPPLGTIEAALERPFGESLEQHLANLRPAIAVAVGEEQDLGLTRGDDSSPCRTDPETGRQPIGPDLRAIDATVAVGVAQLLDGAVRLGLRRLLVPLVRLDPAHHPVELPALVQLLDVILPLQVVAVQFGDEELPAFIPAHT